MRWARLLLFVAEDEQRAVSAMIGTLQRAASLLDCLFCFVCIAFGVVDTYVRYDMYVHHSVISVHKMADTRRLVVGGQAFVGKEVLFHFTS